LGILTNWAAYLLLFVVSGFLIYQYIDAINGGLWDLSVYQRAANDILEGRNPYRTDVTFAFVYPPVVLSAFSFIDKLTGLGTALLSFYILATAWFLIQSYRFMAISPRFEAGEVIRFLIIVTATVAFGDAGSIAVQTGNITLFIHFVLVGCLFNFLRFPTTSRHFLFGFLILGFSVIKPYFLLYSSFYFLTLPVRVATRFTVAIFLAFCAIWAFDWVVHPDQFAAFLKTLLFQTLAKHDLGYSFFGLISMSPLRAYALPIHLFVIAGLFFLNFIAWQRRLLPFVSPHSEALLLLAWIILANPRMKEYDFFILSFAAFFFIFKNLGLRAPWLVLIAVGTWLLVDVPSINIFLPSPYLWQLVTILVLLTGVVFSGQLPANKSRRQNVGMF
jgi:hypothetical protein